MKDFLKIENFSCGYSTKFVLKPIDINVNKGSMFGIVGPNGSGKTTLFRGISGELPPGTGHIHLDNHDLLRMGYREKAQHIAIVTQNVETPDVTVEEYVLMGRLPYRKPFMFFETAHDFDLAHEYLKSTDIFHLKNKKMTELSGGEQQLASIARALTQQPDLLLLDEPTSHLDIGHQVHVMNYLQQLNHDMGLTVLMIIHDLNLAGEYCDYLVLMNEGRVHVQGKPSEVLDYANIEAVYNTVVVTKNNPVSGRPAVFLVSDRTIQEHRKKI